MYASVSKNGRPVCFAKVFPRLDFPAPIIPTKKTIPFEILFLVENQPLGFFSPFKIKITVIML
jgi:hypothetical protein